MSGDPKDDYLANGITDDLTTALSHIGGAFVISRATAHTFRDRAEDIRKIGRELEVRYVLRGSMQRFGQTLRLNAELSSTETGAQLWSDNFDQPILPLYRVRLLLSLRAVAHFRTGDVEAAMRLVAEQYPLDTVRGTYPDDPGSEIQLEQFRSIQHALTASGHRDHLAPDADFGIRPEDALLGAVARGGS